MREPSVGQTDGVLKLLTGSFIFVGSLSELCEQPVALPSPLGAGGEA